MPGVLSGCDTLGMKLKGHEQEWKDEQQKKRGPGCLDPSLLLPAPASEPVPHRLLENEIEAAKDSHKNEHRECVEKEGGPRVGTANHV
jgi:hypothetical protein